MPRLLSFRRLAGWLLLLGLLAPVARAAESRAVLTNIAAIKALHPAEAESRWPVRFRGFLTGGKQSGGDMYVQDDQAAVYLMPHPAFAGLPLGQEVEIQGRTSTRVSGPIVVVSNLTVLDRVVLPEPRPATAQDLMDERWDGLRVVVDGVVNVALRNTRVPTEGSFVIGLALQDGSLPVYITGRPDLEWLLKSAGTRLRVTGICRPLVNPRGLATTGGMVAGLGDTFERMDAKSPTLAQPKYSERSIRQLSQYHGNPSAAEYASIEGVVTAVLSQRTFFLQDETGGMLVRTLRPESVEPGDRLAAEGLPQRDFIPSAGRADESYAVVFHAHDLRRLGRNPLPEPRRLGAKHVVEAPFNYRRVALDATLLGTARGADDSGSLRMNLQAGDRLLEGMVRSVPAQAGVPAPGSRVRVQGVLDQRPRPDSDQEALRIHLAHIGDLAVLKPPPPDYAPVLGWIAVAVSLLVVLTLSWALTLRRSVRLRTAELEQATAAKSQFLANMSHEIRTPMHAMLGLVQVLGRQPLSAAQAELVRNVAQAGKSLLRILNDILDYSRVEAGQLVLERQAFTLPEFLAHLDTLFRESAHGRGLRWEVHPPAGAPVEGPLLGDPVRVQQILANLASNAIKFTEHGGVELTTQILLADADHVRVRFTVTDTGPGIPPQTLARLFQPFTQADASIHRRYGGTGLGLSICRRLTELMGGTLGADSQPGQGSTFWVELPFPRAQAPAEAAAAAAAKPQAGRRPLAGRRVMVVDDNPLNRRLAEWVLTEEGATALLVDSAVAALAQLGTGPAPVDAVLMDLQMPELDGLEATRRLRQQPGHATLPILACTADTSPQTRATALAAGATDFLPKPVDVDDLVAALVRCLPASPEPAAPAPEPMAPTAAPDLASLPSVPGLDTGHAARALRGDARLHRRMVREFVAQFGDLAGQMRGDLAAGRRPAAARRLHQLLGITGYVGALDLANTARQLQETLRTDNADATSLLDAFADELESLLQTLREHLAISAENEGAPTPATRAEPVVQR